MEPEDIGKGKIVRYKRRHNMGLSPSAEDYKVDRFWAIEWDTPMYLKNTEKRKATKQDEAALERVKQSDKKAQLQALNPKN
jgi:hypothetical protein